MNEKLRTAFHTRQYMLSKDFEIYYYSDKGMKQVADHTHNYYEFYFFLNGDVSIEINGENYALKTGDMILIPPNTRHHLNVQNPEEAYQRLIFWISKDYCDQLEALSEDYVYPMKRAASSKEYIHHFDVFVSNELQSKCFTLISELKSERFGKEARLALCLNDLVFSISRSVYELENPNYSVETHSLYNNLITYIENNIAGELTLESLANEFFVSKYHIAHIFKQNLGISIHQYIIKKRLAMCRDAIQSRTLISEAYLLCGFKDYTSFYRAFKKEYGLSPKEYQQLLPISNITC